MRSKSICGTQRFDQPASHDIRIRIRTRYFPFSRLAAGSRKVRTFKVPLIDIMQARPTISGKNPMGVDSECNRSPTYSCRARTRNEIPSTIGRPGLRLLDWSVRVRWLAGLQARSGVMMTMVHGLYLSSTRRRKQIAKRATPLGHRRKPTAVGEHL